MGSILQFGVLPRYDYLSIVCASQSIWIASVTLTGGLSINSVEEMHSSGLTNAEKMFVHLLRIGEN